MLPRLALWMTMAAALTACAADTAGLLVPVAPRPGSPRVDMLAATTRSPSDSPGVVFGGERGEGIAFSRIVVTVPPGRDPGNVSLPRSAPGDPARDFTVAALERLDAAGARAWLETARGKPRRVFVFVHGFNTRFDRAVLRFAQLVHDSDADATPVLFSWPSRGRLLDYKRDIDNASYSRTDLARVLEAAAASPQVSEITILAHSMGSWLAVESLRQIALARSPALRKVNNLILASPDLDVGVFRRQVEDMGKRRPHVTLFVASHDRALRVSGFLSGGLTRLGAIDPAQDDYRRQLEGVAGVTVLDLSALRSDDRLNHDLYARSPEVVRLVGERLIQGQLVTDEDVGPGIVAEAFGSATVMVLAAPILAVRTSSD